MTSYAESRSSRRNDPPLRPREEQYLKPTTGTSESRRRSRSGERRAEGHGQTQTQTQAYARQPSPYRYRSSTEPRYDPSDYPPPLGPDPARSSRRPRSRSRRRQTWPPQPTVEDEATSLAREAGTQLLIKNLRRDEARSRGKINQEPILEEVPEFINQDERRFVLSDKKTKGNGGLPTPPTSEDEKARKARRRPSKLDMSFNKVNEGVPEMNKRPASPYTFKPSSKSKEEPPTKRYLSPETLLSPPPTDPRNRNRTHVETRSQPSSPRRERGRYSPSNRSGDDYFSLGASESAIDDSDHDQKRPSTYPPSRDAANTSPQTSVVDFARQPPSMPARRMNLDSRRNTDSQSTLPTMQNIHVEKNRRGNPSMASSALSELNDARLSESPKTLQPSAEFPRPREASYASSRPVSPADSVASATESTGPRRSPRMSAEFPRNRGYESSPTTSRTASISGSVSGSRPSSPSPRTPNDSSRLPKTDMDWSALMAVNAARRPKGASRLSAEIRPESMNDVSRSQPRQGPSRIDSFPNPPPSRTESLPYPMDQGPWTPNAYMPSERMHQYFPDTKSSMEPRSTRDDDRLSTSASSTPGTNSYLSTNSSRPTRPSPQSRHSFAELPQPEKRPQLDRPKLSDTRRSSFSTPSQVKKDLAVVLKRGFGLCPRTVAVSGYSDWYTLSGAPTLNFCPQCIDHIFDKTSFRNYFRRSPPTKPSHPTVCALGGDAWIKLAMLLTIQQQRPDLTLLKDIAEIDAQSTSTPCPGNTSALRTWYGLRDTDGLFLKDFHICYPDIRKLERLLPTLSGFFVGHPSLTNTAPHLCALRPEGNRFSLYIDTLIHTHEKALSTRTPADPTPFLTTITRRQRLRECTRDTLISNGLWHYIPQLPEFTVCEDCYVACIEPRLKQPPSSTSSDDLARRFHRTLQPTYPSPTSSEMAKGNSCQLYSNRMRSVWDTAVKHNDFKYLARKARERREAEVRLQERYQEVLRKYGGGRRGEWGEQRLERVVQEISGEWVGVWE